MPRRVHAANCGGNGHKAGDNGGHIIGEETGVRAGVGAELLFIQGLQVVQGLLCRIAKQTVGVTLEGGQVVQCRGLFALFLSLHGLNDCSLAFAGSCDILRFGLVLMLLCDSVKAH